MTRMTTAATAVTMLFAFTAGAGFGAEPEKPTFTQATFDRTLTGQQVVLPQGPVKVGVLLATFPAGWKGPVHKQIYPRYAYILSGRLRVTYVDLNVVKEFGPGETIIEGVDQWHWVEPVGPDAVKVLVVDQAPPGQSSLVVRKP